MQKCSACVGVCAMLIALVSAPLVHMHDRDDVGHAAIHAHFFESEIPSHTTGYAVETDHSHGHGKWVDFFALSAPVIKLFYATAEFSQILFMPAPNVTRAAVPVETLRAHSPPEAADLVPRSPPTV